MITAITIATAVWAAVLGRHIGLHRDELEKLVVGCGTIKAVLDLAHNFSLKVVAEGVETEAVADTLSEMGCDILQGYAFDKPLPVEDFEKRYHIRGDREVAGTTAGTLVSWLLLPGQHFFCQPPVGWRLYPQGENHHAKGDSLYGPPALQ